MSLTQGIVAIALGILGLKAIASVTGKGNIPLLNLAVSVVLFAFVAFELSVLGRALVARLG
ncbi:MAG: hypothetical protein AAF704_00795 [Cyanobacteria bacterium P01_D01_bin.123]